MDSKPSTPQVMTRAKSDVLIVIRCQVEGISRVITVSLAVRTVNNDMTSAKTRLQQAEMTGAGGVVRRLRSRRGPHEYKNARTYLGVCKLDTCFPASTDTYHTSDK
jgi:hypothetical protein